LKKLGALDWISQKRGSAHLEETGNNSSDKLEQRVVSAWRNRKWPILRGLSGQVSIS